MAILLEHTNGKLPFWLSPRQVCVIPVATSEPKLVEYCERVATSVRGALLSSTSTAHNFGSAAASSGVVVDVDLSSESLKKKVRNAQQAPYSVTVVVGWEEVDSDTVALRSNDGKQMRPGVKLVDFVNEVRLACVNRVNDTFVGGVKF
jgi:threonyl-tRNA synthetase